MHDQFSEITTIPPFLDITRIIQRVDEVNAIQRMLAAPQTSALMLVGEAGVGKTTLAALLFHRFAMAKEADLPAPKALIWLNIHASMTFPEMLMTLLEQLGAFEPDFVLLKPQQQISTLLRALRRPGKSVFLVLDHFDLLLQADDTGTRMKSVLERELFSHFSDMLRTGIGGSRILLTGRESLFEQSGEHPVRSYLVSRISIPEGIALLQQQGITGSQEELSLIWQRCAGHVFSLVLFCAVVRVSGLSPSTLLFTDNYQYVWRDDVVQQLVTLFYQHLNALQRQVLRVLSLFTEPIPVSTIVATMSNEQAALPDLQTNESFMNRFKQELRVLTQCSVLQIVLVAQQEPCFELHAVVRRYVIAHYAETSEAQGQEDAALGVSGPRGLMQVDAEAQEVALAAGHRQVASYYQAVAREQCPPREERTRLRDVMPIIATIRHLCLGYQWQAGCELLFSEGLHQMLPRCGAHTVLIGLYTALVPPLGMVQRRDEGLMCSHLATLHGWIGDYEQSERYFARALAVQHEVGDTRGMASSLTNRGELCRLQMDTVQAQACFEQAIALNTKQKSPKRQDVHLRSVVLHNMGLLYHQEKDYDAASHCYIHALRLSYQLQEQYDKGTILTNLGLLLYEQGRLRDALSVLLAALRLRQTLQDGGVTLLTRFLFGIEQKMGTETYTHLCRAALETQEEVVSRLLTVNIPV
jgi:tetratricopeptide (TPR) repeat protein